MTGFESNLLAEAIGIIVGLPIGLWVTYRIVEAQLKKQEANRWKPARDDLLRAMIRHLNKLIVDWALAAEPPRTTGSEVLESIADDAGSEAFVQKLTDELKAELKSLQELDLIERYHARSPKYWSDLLSSLTNEAESIDRAILRTQLTLGTEPQLIPAINEFEKHYFRLPSIEARMKSQLSSNAGSGDSAKLGAGIVIASSVTMNAFSSVVRLRDEIHSCLASQ